MYIFIGLLFLTSNIFSSVLPLPLETTLSSQRMEEASLESRIVKPYNKIIVYSSVKVVLMPSTSKADRTIVMLKGDEELKSQIKLIVANNTLHIYLDYQSYQQGKMLIVMCFIDKIKNILAESGAYITMDSKSWAKPLSSSALTIEARDHAKVILPKIKINHLITILKDSAEVVVSGWASTHEGKVMDQAILQSADLYTDKTSIALAGPQGVIAHLWD